MGVEFTRDASHEERWGWSPRDQSGREDGWFVQVDSHRMHHASLRSLSSAANVECIYQTTDLSSFNSKDNASNDPRKVHWVHHWLYSCP